MDPIKCPSCSARLNLPGDMVGQEVRCPRCNTSFVAQRDMDLGTPFGSRDQAARNGSRAGSAHIANWKEGDRILAPWEDEWLYPGVVRCVDEDVVFIRFDDGDRALRSVEDIEPISIRKGDTIYCRRDRDERRYYPATVLRVRGEELEVEYEDGASDQMTVSFVRVRRM